MRVVLSCLLARTLTLLYVYVYKVHITGVDRSVWCGDGGGEGRGGNGGKERRHVDSSVRGPEWGRGGGEVIITKSK